MSEEDAWEHDKALGLLDATEAEYESATGSKSYWHKQDQEKGPDTVPQVPSAKQASARSDGTTTSGQRPSPSTGTGDSPNSILGLPRGRLVSWDEVRERNKRTQEFNAKKDAELMAAAVLVLRSIERAISEDDHRGTESKLRELERDTAIEFLEKFLSGKATEEDRRTAANFIMVVRESGRFKE